MLLGLSMFSLLKTSCWTSLRQPFDLISHPTFAFVLSFLVLMLLVDLYGLTKVVRTLFHFGILMWHLVSLIVRVMKFQDNQVYHLFILGFIQNELFFLERTIYKRIIVLTSLSNMVRNTSRFSISRYLSWCL